MMWLKGRSTASCCAALMVCAFLVPLLGGMPLPVPRIGVGPAPFLLVLPIIASTALIRFLGGPLQWQEALSARPVVVIAATTVYALIASMVCTWLMVGVALHDVRTPIAASRNLLGYVGMAFIAARLGGELTAYAAPTAYALIVAILGTPGNLLWWAIAAPTDWLALMTSALLLGLGSAMTLPRRAQLAMSQRRDQGEA